MSEQGAVSRRERPTMNPWFKTIGAAILAAGVVCVVLLGFSWPTLAAGPNHVPVVVTGPDAEVEHFQDAVTAADPDALDLTTTANRYDAVRMIEKREAAGAVILDPEQPEVLITSAGGAQAKQLMTAIAGNLQTELNQLSKEADRKAVTVEVTDVVPLSADDPNGSRFAIAALPMSIGGVLCGVLVSSLVIGVSRQLAGLVGAGLGVGFALGAILQYWYGALDGPYVINSLAISLTVLAISSVVAGLRQMVGAAGLGLSAFLFILGANPISGATVQSDFLPRPWGAIGQWLPQGAGRSLLQGLSYFPDAITASHWAVLVGWAVIGTALLVAASVRKFVDQQSSVPETEHGNLAAASG